MTDDSNQRNYETRPSGTAEGQHQEDNRKPQQMRPKSTTQTMNEMWECCRTGKEQDLFQALEMVKMQPSLASQFYDEIDQGDFVVKRMRPLHMMLVARASLAVVKEVHQLFPQALFDRLDYNGFSGLPLNYICANYGSTNLEVLDFVASFHTERHPPADYSVGLLPIHLALQSKQHLERHHWPCLEVFQILLRHFPAFIAMRDEQPIYHMHPLEWSFHMEYSQDIQEYFMDRYLLAEADTENNGSNQTTRDNYFRLDISRGDDRSFDRRQATLISRLLPNLKTFDVICSKTLCVEGFLALLSFLSVNTSIGNLQILKLPNLYISYFECVWHALRGFLGTNTAVQELTLSARRHVYDDEEKLTGRHHRNMFRALAEGLRHNSSIQSLSLKHMEIPDSQSLSDFMSEGVTIFSLKMEDVRIDFPWDKDDDDDNDTWRPSQHLERLKIKISNVISSESLLSGIFQRLSGLPSLKELSLTLKFDHGMVFDVTALLATLLQRNRLEKLSVMTSHKGPQQPVSVVNINGGPAGTPPQTTSSIDVPRLCTTSLKTNTSLQVFKCNLPIADDDSTLTTLLTTLEQHNATLTNIAFDTWNSSILKESMFSTSTKQQPQQQQQVRIWYWLLLNQHERALARAATTTTAQLAELLCRQRDTYDENDDESPPRPPVDDDSDNKMKLFNVYYGLLRELPSIWSCRCDKQEQHEQSQ